MATIVGTAANGAGSGSEGYSATSVPAGKLSGAALFKAELVVRRAALIAWLRALAIEMVSFRDSAGHWKVRPAVAAEACAVCARRRALLVSLGCKPGLVLLDGDNVKENRVEFSNAHHDVYHLGVALTAIRNEEYAARVERRGKFNASRAGREKVLVASILIGEVEHNTPAPKRGGGRKGGRFTAPRVNYTEDGLKRGQWSSGHRRNPAAK